MLIILGLATSKASQRKEKQSKASGEQFQVKLEGSFRGFVPFAPSEIFWIPFGFNVAIIAGADLLVAD